ncbi:MAG: M28 family peptidase [Alphaproteobacteria bacterium]|nr:M28 family peptidase [Alphaproteobacteria bacterium]
MRSTTFPAIVATCFALSGCVATQTPAAGLDADTAAWWEITGDLSGDAMEGRDTGSPGHARAVNYVIDRFGKAGLKPAGDAGGWTQTLPLKEVRVEKDGTSFEVLALQPGATPTRLSFLHEISVRATDELPASIEGALSFRGYCSPAEMGEVLGRVVVCFGARRSGLPGGADRMRAVADAGAVGLINIDDPGFTVEPARWPDAYARSVSLRSAPSPAFANLPVMRLSPDGFERMLQSAGHATPSADILASGAASRPLAAFDLALRMQATFSLSRREYTSDNVLAMLPGSDPALSQEVVIVSAHIDGYGFGEPVEGDALYNGAFDDAAYVATIIRLAEQRAGQGFRRSVLFAVYTGEEKGLLGSNWLSRNLPVPKENLAAVINLDQLRPLFPLKILTMHAIGDTTLKANVDRVAAGMGIEIRPDLEPERNLNQRTDHWPFLSMGVPATNFVFGFDPGTEAEARYREWYKVRYHRPQDDMSQPLDFQAAADMNTFFYRLTGDVANDPARPAFLPGSRTIRSKLLAGRIRRSVAGQTSPSGATTLRSFRRRPLYRVRDWGCR